MTVFTDPPPLLELPPPPTPLGDAGLARWKEAGGSLIRRRILTALDTRALAVHCSAFDVLAGARRDVDRFGLYLVDPETGAHVLNPAVEIMQETRAEIRESARTLLLE